MATLQELQAERARRQGTQGQTQQAGPTVDDLLQERARRQSAGGYDELSAMSQNPQVQAQEPRKMGTIERIADNLIGLDNGVMSGGEVAAAALNKAGESMTLGLVGDETSAAVEAALNTRGTGASYEDRRDQYRQQEQQLRTERPGVALAAEIAPAFIPGVGAAGVAGRMTTKIGRAATGAVLAGSAAGTYGFAEGEGQADRFTDGAIGATLGTFLGAAAPRVADALTGIPNGLKRLFTKSEQRPTVELLRATKNAAYNAVEQSGEVFQPAEMQGLARTVRDTFESGNYVDDVDNASRAALNILDRQTGPTTLPQLDRIRQNLWKRYAGAKDQPQLLDAIGAIDDLVESRAGSSELMAAARAANSRFAKSQLLEDAFTKATDQTASTGSGGNILNKYRQAVTGIINNPSKARFFSESEIDLMRGFVRGSTTENVQRLIGKLSPSGNGLMMALHTIGGVASGGASIPLMMVGAGAKSAADRSVQRGADQVQNVLSGYRPIPVAPQLTRVGSGAATLSGAGVNAGQQRLPSNTR
jgi:hypothetical protein